jgi:hypothetical protein
MNSSGLLAHGLGRTRPVVSAPKQNGQTGTVDGVRHAQPCGHHGLSRRGGVGDEVSLEVSGRWG